MLPAPAAPPNPAPCQGRQVNPAPTHLPPRPLPRGLPGLAAVSPRVPLRAAGGTAEPRRPQGPGGCRTLSPRCPGRADRRGGCHQTTAPSHSFHSSHPHFSLSHCKQLVLLVLSASAMCSRGAEWYLPGLGAVHSTQELAGLPPPYFSQSLQSPSLLLLGHAWSSRHWDCPGSWC